MKRNTILITEAERQLVESRRPRLLQIVRELALANPHKDPDRIVADAKIEWQRRKEEKTNGPA